MPSSPSARTRRTASTTTSRMDHRLGAGRLRGHRGQDEGNRQGQAQASSARKSSATRPSSTSRGKTENSSRSRPSTPSPAGAQLTLLQVGQISRTFAEARTSSTRASLKAFKLLRVAGAPTGVVTSQGPMLQRLYGTAFCEPQRAASRTSQQLEEAKKRDHRKLGKELGLFHFDPIAPASPFFTGRGALIYNLLIAYVREPVRASTATTRSSRRRSSTWSCSRPAATTTHYKDNMFIVRDRRARVRGQADELPEPLRALRQHVRHSYRELPIRMADFGRLHRYERAGVTHGLTRVRTFCQDDAHVFCRVDQLEDEIEARHQDDPRDLPSLFGFEEVEVEISHPPRSPTSVSSRPGRPGRGRAGEPRSTAQGILKYVINEGDGAFYGPEDRLPASGTPCVAAGSSGPCQLDFQLPERFEPRVCRPRTTRREPAR